MQPVKVATTQYEIGFDREANLLAILQRIDEAADNGADIVLFPEFTNHATWYRDQDHCWEVAVDQDGQWVGAIRDRARARNIWVAFNAATRSDRPVVYDQNYLIDRNGTIVGTVRKKVLIGSENDYMTKDQIVPEVFDTELGRIGFTTCMDGVLPETARTVSVLGAQIILDSLNSNARDEGSMHVPSRAVENAVFMISSCKSGPLIPLDAAKPLLELRQIHPQALKAPGEAQIVAPDGTVLAKGGFLADQIVYATINPADADNKVIPGCGDLIADRRPDTYSLLTVANEDLPLLTNPPEGEPAPFVAAALQTILLEDDFVTVFRAVEVAEEAADRGATFIVLPELFAFAEGSIANDPAAAAARSNDIAQQLRDLAAARNLHIVASLVEQDGDRFHHTTYLWNADGEAAKYRQVHLREGDRRWATAGDSYVTVDTPLGRIGLMAGYDGLFPEVPRILAMLGADILAYPTCWRAAWEPSITLRERAAENHVAIIAANRLDSPVDRGSIIATVPQFPSRWRGRLNPVDTTESAPDLETFVFQTVNPVASRNKVMMPKTDAVQNRRAELHGPLVATH